MTTITSTVEPGAVYAPDSPLDYSEPAVPGTMILDDLVAPRDGWSAVVTKGDVLTIIDVGGNQSADCLIYDAADTTNRYSVPHTLAAQANVYVRTGTVLRSNQSDPLMTVVANEVDRRTPSVGPAARNPTLCATATTPTTTMAAARTSSSKPGSTAWARATWSPTSTGS